MGGGKKIQFFTKLTKRLEVLIGIYTRKGQTYPSNRTLLSCDVCFDVEVAGCGVI